MTASLAGDAGGAAWAGAHGLALYLGGLMLVLACSAAGGAWARRRAPPAQAAAGLGPLLRRLGLGCALAAVAAGLFAATAWQLRAGSALGAADAAFLLALRPTVSPEVRLVFAGLTHAADTRTLTLLCIAGAIALLAHRQTALAAAWVLAIAGNGLLNVTLKQAFGRVRPAHLEGVLATPGLSFPSGHSAGAVVAYGMAAYLAWRLLAPRWHLPALLLAAALAYSIGASRLVLQVHFPSDVLAGFASGSAWLALCITGLAAAQRGGLARQATAQP